MGLESDGREDSQMPLFDREWQESRYGDRKPFLQDLLGMYREDAVRLRDAAGELLAAGDAVGAAAAVHSLKGISGTVGAVAVQACALRLERLLTAHDLGAARPAFKELQAILARTLEVLGDKEGMTR